MNNERTKSNKIKFSRESDILSPNDTVGREMVTPRLDTIIDGVRVGDVEQHSVITGIEEIETEPAREKTVTTGVEVSLLKKGKENGARKERLKEAGVRILAGTALFTVLGNLGSAASETVNEKLSQTMPSHSMTIGGRDPDTGTRQEIGPGVIAPSIEDGPSLGVDQLQDNNPDFEVPALSYEQSQNIAKYVDDLAKAQHEVIAAAKADGLTDEQIAQHDVGGIRVEIAGKSSDEAGPEPGVDGMRNVGQPSEKNEIMARDYGQAVYTEVERLLSEKGVTGVELWPVTGTEKILAQEQINQLDEIAEIHGVSLSEVIGSYNYGEGNVALEASDIATLDSLLKANRGADMSSSIVTANSVEVGPCDIVQMVRTIEYDIPGQDPTEVEIFLIPGYLPAFRRRKGTKTVPAKTGYKITGESWYEGAAKLESNSDENDMKQSFGVGVGNAPHRQTGIHSRRPARYNDEKSKLRHLALPIAAGLLVIPTGFGYESGEAASNPVGQCTVVSEKEGGTAKIDIFSAIGGIVGVVAGGDYATGKVSVKMPSSHEKIYSAHKKITVDENGQVIHTQNVPERTSAVPGTELFPSIDVQSNSR